MPTLRLEPLESRDVPSTASPALRFLGDMQDEFHTRLPVYDDVSSAGNHFHAAARIPSASAPVDLDGSWVSAPHSGATAIRNTFAAGSAAGYGGLYFQNGLLATNGATVPNFGDTPNAGVSIPAPARLTFWARGEAGGERVEFFALGVGRDAATGVPTNPFPDSSPRVPAAGTATTLTPAWQQYTIDLAGVDTGYVLGGFAWVATDAANPGGAVFYLDDIQYELTPAGQAARLAEPRLVRSYRTADTQNAGGAAGDFDFILRNSAFTYDNALVALAFLADRDPATRADSLRRARLVGDALVYATAHDRRYDDGRVRSDYAAGDRAVPPGWVANGRPGTAPVAGFYSDAQDRFFEILQLNTDTGNNTWAMVALLGLYSRTGDAAYLTAATRIGEFILTLRQDTGTYRGFLGGVNNSDSLTASPTPRPYASTEHNIDVYAAFTRMYEITGDERWRAGADHAWAFVEAMYDGSIGLYRAGTTDPETRNTVPGQLPLDVQAWAVLARPAVVLAAHPGLLAAVEQAFGVTEPGTGVAGFDFNNDRDGVWTEGTAQMGTAYAVAGDFARAVGVRATLDHIRTTTDAPKADGLGLPATLHDGLTTGFQTEDGAPFLYHERLHTGATAWNVFAQLGFNPYYQTYAAPRGLLVSGPPDGVVAVYVPSVPTAPAATLDPFDIPGVVRIASGDVDGDGVADVVAATGPGTPLRVTVVSGADFTTVLVEAFDPFGGGFTGGGYVAAGDLDGDGKAEFVVTPDQGGGPRVSVFRRNPDGTTAVVANFLGIDDANFRGGARSAVGDVNGDGTPDVIVAAGFGGGPRVAVFGGPSVRAGTPARLVNDFFAFPGADAERLRNGAFVAAGDVTGDGRAELVFGGGPGGAPRVFILSGALVAAGQVDAAQAGPVANFFVAGNTTDRGGVRLAARDLDGDGRPEVAAASGERVPARVRVYAGASFVSPAEPGSFQDIIPFGGVALADGMYVG